MKAKNPKYSLLVVTSLITSAILYGEIAASYASSVENRNAESITIRLHSNNLEITQPLNQELTSQLLGTHLSDVYARRPSPRPPSCPYYGGCS
ncbi:MAG: hypothetical protein V7K38_21955 [Nostoc sp.]|uniref:hypothetical protein n=1 Tax=Nostoc sp. TaxID=1180 RepID=UPI002FF9A99F